MGSGTAQAASRDKRAATRTDWGAHVRLLRPGNAVMSAAAVGVGAFVAGGSAGLAESGVRVMLGAIAAFAFTGAGNAANDLRDVDIDRTAHPDRPLVTGAVPERRALGMVIALYAVAVACAVALGWPAFLLVAGALVLMEAYERWLKPVGVAGNGVVAALTGAPFVVGGLAVHALPLTVLTLAGLAALATLGREILKDVEDMEADAAEGRRRTLPLRVGAARAHAIAAGALVLAVLLSPVPFVQETLLGWLYLFVVGVADAGFVAAALMASRPDRAQRVAKLAMLVALVAFVAGKLHAEWVQA